MVVWRFLHGALLAPSPRFAAPPMVPNSRAMQPSLCAPARLAEEEQPSFERGHLYETRLQAALNKLNKAVKCVLRIIPHRISQHLMAFA